MSLQKGDVVLARVPHTAGTRGKKRPAVVVQANAYNATLRHVVVAEATSNPRWSSDPACVLIDVATPEGQLTGLHKNGVVSCLHLVTMNADRLSQPNQSFDGRRKPALIIKTLPDHDSSRRVDVQYRDRHFADARFTDDDCLLEAEMAIPRLSARVEERHDFPIQQARQIRSL